MGSVLRALTFLTGLSTRTNGSSTGSVSVSVGRSVAGARFCWDGALFVGV